MERRKRTRIRRKNVGMKKLIVILLLAFIIMTLLIKVIVPGAVTLSRYVYKKVRSYFLLSQEFYFNSDKLSIDGAHFEASNWSGVDDYVVSVNMNSKHNNIEVSPVDIDYTITATCAVYKSDGTLYPVNQDGSSPYIDYELSKSTGRILVSADNRDFFDITVKPKGLTLYNDDYVVVSITAESTSPYVQTLTGEFKIIIGNLGVSYMIEDKPYDSYLQLRITNTLDYYVVENAFGSHSAGEVISINDYLALSDTDKAKCYSMQAELINDPNQVVIDTTTSMYLVANDNGDTVTEVLPVEEGGGTVNYNYVDSIKFKIDAEESRLIKYYKKTVTKDYTYPGSSVDTLITSVDTNSDGTDDQFTVKFYDKAEFLARTDTSLTEENFVFLTIKYKT